MVAHAKDFTNNDKPENIEITVDQDVFIAVGEAPAMAILDVAGINKAEDVEKVQILFAFLDKVLLPDSAARFLERLGSPTEPITIDQATDIAVWLVQEAYAPERPTEAPSSSQNGSGSTGPTSTDTASEPESTRIL